MRKDYDLDRLITPIQPSPMFDYMTPKFARRTATETVNKELGEMADYLRISVFPKPNTEFKERLVFKLENAIKTARLFDGNEKITTSIRAHRAYWNTTVKLIKKNLKPHI